MRALKRAISLFLAGITALTMMCVGTISAGAVQTSKLWVEALDAKSYSTITVGLQGISSNDYTEALKLVTETIEAFTNEERDDFYYICAEVTLRSNKETSNLRVIWLGTQYYIVYVNDKAVSNTDGLSVAASSRSDGYTQFQWKIPSKSSHYQSVRNVLENCTQVTAAFGVMNSNTQEKKLSDGSTWKPSDVTYDVSDFKTSTASDSSSNKTNNSSKKTNEYTLTGKENSKTYELTIEGKNLDSNGSHILNIFPSKKDSEKTLQVYYNCKNANGKKSFSGAYINAAFKKEFDDSCAVKSISYNSSTKKLSLTFEKTDIIKKVMDYFKKKDSLYISHMDDENIVTYTANAEWNSSSVSKPKKTTLTVKKTDEKYTFSWGKVSGVDKYQIYYSTDGKNYTKLANISGKKTSYSTTKLDESKTYSFKIRSYKKVDGKTYYSKFSKVVKK